jgi:hypothetical protein
MLRYRMIYYLWNPKSAIRRIGVQRALVVVLAIWFAAGATASTLTPNYSGFVSNCLDQTGNYRTNPACWAGTSGNPGTAAANVTLTGTGSTVTVNERASAACGLLQASTSTSLNASNTATYASAWAIAGFMDVLTISDAPYTGQQGSLLLDYTIAGTASATGPESSFAYVNVNVGANLEQRYVSPVFTSAVNSNIAIAKTFTFTFGQPFGIYFYLTGFSGSNGYVTNATASAAANFSADLLSSLTVQYPTGIVATAQAASGRQYNVIGAPLVVGAPEPSTASLLALGFSAFWLACAVRRKWTSRTPRG